MEKKIPHKTINPHEAHDLLIVRYLTERAEWRPNLGERHTCKRSRRSRDGKKKAKAGPAIALAGNAGGGRPAVVVALCNKERLTLRDFVSRFCGKYFLTNGILHTRVPQFASSSSLPTVRS
jgi:hypothetical protein